jgi:hypothetical protein
MCPWLSCQRIHQPCELIYLLQHIRYIYYVQRKHERDRAYGLVHMGCSGEFGSYVINGLKTVVIPELPHVLSQQLYDLWRQGLYVFMGLHVQNSILLCARTNLIV